MKFEHKLKVQMNSFMLIKLTEFWSEDELLLELTRLESQALILS